MVMEGKGICNWFKSHRSLYRVFMMLFLGQLVSFILSITSFSSSYLASRGVNAPITQSFFSYFGLASIYGTIMLFRRRKLLVPWYYYVVLAFVDLQGSYLVTKAFQFTSITSVTLLDCWTIPWVMVLTWFFIGTRYTVWQYIGATICIFGLGLVLLSDAGIGGGGGGSRPLLGDFLVIVGTMFYAVTNVGEEFCVKQKDLVEFISMIGVFGLMMTICEIALLERHNLEAIEWSSDVILGFVGYAVAACLFYTLVPILLKLSGAALLNLSLLTSDMWAVLARVLFYHYKVDGLYYVSFAIVVAGLVIYSKTETKPAPVPTVVDEHAGVQYEALGEDSSIPRDGTLIA
ncbi:unnamed protein product [Amaranthus hypochondriacus]